MAVMVYFIIIILFLIYFSWAWNSSRGFENIALRISFILIGTLFVTFVTYIIFLFSKIGVEYPRDEMIKYVRNIILLVFVPINGFATLPQLINIFNRIKDGNISQEEKERKIKILSIVILVLLIFECFYFKNIQNSIINYIHLKQ